MSAIEFVRNTESVRMTWMLFWRLVKFSGYTREAIDPSRSGASRAPPKKTSTAKGWTP